MVRVKHFAAVPDAGIRKDIRRLDRTQMLLEGKYAPSNASASTMSLTSRTIARSRSVVIGTPETKAEQVIEHLLPKEVIWYRGSLASGKLAFQLPVGILHITIPEKCLFLDHHVTPDNGDAKSRCEIVGNVEKVPALQAMEILEVVKFYITATYCVSKASLTQRLKSALLPHNRFHELHSLLRTPPREICESSNVARFGWHFLRVESILDTQLEFRFKSRIAHLRSQLTNLTLSEISESVPLPARSKSKSTMIDYLLQPLFAFHGPKSEFIPNIAAHGLLAAGDINPSTGERIPGRLGSTYGPGVYVTDEAHLALTYANWDRASLLSLNHTSHHKQPCLPGTNRKRMLICATVLGRAALVTPADGFRDKTEMFPGAHSHVANGGREFVVPPEQVLPLYVVDFDWVPVGEEEKRKYLEFAEEMVAPPGDDVEEMGRWYRVER